MCSELLYGIFAILVLFVVDNYSTSFSVVICGLFIYFYIQIFSKGSNKDRYVVSLIIKAWGGVSYIFLLWKQLIIITKNAFFTKKYLRNPHQSSNHYCGEKACIEKEIDVIVYKISQCYLHSWYDKVGDNEEFILHLNSVIKEALVGLCTKLTRINRKRISYAILQIYLHFFIHFTNAKKKSEPKLDDFEMKHWAFQDSTSEWCYLQSLVSSLINTFGVKDPQKSLHSECSPILHNFVVEILTEHIFYPLSNLLSDPSQLNSWLLKILEMYVDVDKNFDSDLLNNKYIYSASKDRYYSGPKILLEVEDSLPNDRESIINKSQHTLTVNNTDSCVDKCEINSTSEKHKKNSDSLSPFMSSGIKSSSNINLIDSDISSVRGSKSEVCSPASCDTSTIKRSKSADYIRQMPTLRALNVKDYNIVMQGESNKMFVALKSDLNPGGFIEQAEEAIEVPTLFSDVRISDTVQQSEAGFLPYTLYCIQYSGVFHDTGKSSEKPYFIKQEVSIKRRFREFLALQSRLEDNPNLKNYLKGIKGPSKWLALPFSNMDKKNIAERKSFLENYLKELCNQGPIAQSSELQEFLAYGGDATVAFVKKAADINVPRIDKIFVRGVKGAIDMFRTALPNTIEGGSSPDSSSATLKPCSEDSMPEHRFQEHLLEYSSREPEIRGHLKHYFKSFANIPHFEHSTGNSDDYPQRASILRYLYKLKVEKSCRCSGTWDIRDENFTLEENAFGNTIIDLMIESLKFSQFSCIHIFSVVKLLFSPTIDRYFISMLDGLSEQHLASFLHILHNAIWPSNNDINYGRSTATAEKYPNTYNKLKQYIKVFIATSNATMNISCIQKLILERIYLFLSSVQYQQLNKCLLFHIFDVVLETMCSNEN